MNTTNDKSQVRNPKIIEHACPACGGNIACDSVDRYTETEIVGMAGVTLIHAVEKRNCIQCGYRGGLLIPNLPGLIATVALVRATVPAKLNGHEIRFLREALAKTAVELASALEVRAEQISRWENDSSPISPQCEKLLRILVLSSPSLRENSPVIANDVHTDEYAWMKIRSVKIRPDEPFSIELTIVRNLKHAQTWGLAA